MWRNSAELASKLAWYSEWIRAQNRKNNPANIWPFNITRDRKPSIRELLYIKRLAVSRKKSNCWNNLECHLCSKIICQGKCNQYLSTILKYNSYKLFNFTIWYKWFWCVSLSLSRLSKQRTQRADRRNGTDKRRVRRQFSVFGEAPTYIMSSEMEAEKEGLTLEGQCKEDWKNLQNLQSFW